MTTILRALTGKDWADKADQDVSLWATYVTYKTMFGQTGDERLSRRADQALLEFFDLFSKGKYNRIIFTELTDDAIGGGISNIPEHLLYADLTQTGHRSSFIKRMTIGHAWQAYHDAKYAREHFGRDEFYLAPTRFEPSVYDDFALLATVIIPGPDVGEIFRVLNDQIQHNPEDPTPANIKDHILEKNLDDLLLWQRHFHETVPPEIAEVEMRKDAVTGRYRGNTLDAIQNAADLTIYEPDSSFVLSDVERELVIADLGLYDNLNLEGRRIVRIRDDTETNSGLELGRMRFEGDRALYEALVEAVTKPTEDGTNGNGKVSPERIDQLYAHWDTATGKFGHFLEDFWRIIDSYRLGLTDYARTTTYRDFLQRKFGETAEAHDVPFDQYVMRFFRSFRHRAVVVSDFARLNEQRYAGGVKDEASRDKKRADYTNKAAHYITMAILALDEAIAKFGINESELPESERSLPLHFRSAMDILGKYGGNPVSCQGTLDDHAQGMRTIIENTDKEDVHRLGQLYALRYITEKMALHNHINFDNLLQS